MATGSIQRVLHHLRQVITRADEDSDGVLLAQFLDREDHSSFAALVERHGRMVLGVCCRVLGNYDDAEDAFQATFLVLVRKAASLRNRATVGNWLHGVAYHVALKARAASIRRREQEQKAMKSNTSPPDEDWLELQGMLDQELQGLPAKYKAPVVLCDLEGLTQREAAHKLGCAEGTLSGRLFRARALLARRLSKHGPMVSGAVLAALLTQANAATASVSPVLLSATVTAAAATAGHVVAAAAVSAKAAALTDNMMRGMLLAKIKMVGAIATSIAVCAGVVVIAGNSARDAVAMKNVDGVGPSDANVQIIHTVRNPIAEVKVPPLQTKLKDNENQIEQAGQHEDEDDDRANNRQQGKQNGPDKQR